MALFDDKILDPEERSGGFEAFQPDDQSFQIEKVGAYPGELPDIGQKKIIPIQEEIEEIDIDSLFDSSSSQDETISNKEIDQNIVDPFSNSINQTETDENGSLWNDWDNSINIDQVVNQAQNDSSDITFAETSNDSLNDNSFEELNSIVKPTEDIADSHLGEIKVVADDTFLDDDFLKDLANEISKAKGRKKSSTENSPLELEDMTNEDKIKHFEGVDNLAETQTIDISAIEAEHPSTANLVSSETDVSQENTVTDNSQEEAKEENKEEKKGFFKKKKKENEVVEKPKKEKKEKPVKEKKERKPIPWKKLIIPGSALFFILLIIGTIALIRNENLMRGLAQSMGFSTDSTQLAKKQLPKKEEHKKEEHKTVSHDTTKKSEHSDSTLAKDTTKSEEHKTNTEVKHEVEAKIEEKTHSTKSDVQKKEIVEPKINKDSHKKDLTEHNTNEPPKKEKEVKKVIEPKKHEPIKHITKNAVTPNKSVEKHKTENKVEPKNEVKNNLHKEPVKEKTQVKKIEKTETKLVQKPTPKSIYTVEIYSSPYKEDAEEWINKLRKKGINNSSISSYKVRDKIWYRVRFGNFDSYESAKEAAIKSGFSQSRIDRIK